MRFELTVAKIAEMELMKPSISEIGYISPLLHEKAREQARSRSLAAVNHVFCDGSYRRRLSPSSLSSLFSTLGGISQRVATEV
ncbi:hypothetical protein E4U53_005335 [Claviceps sorghi]|nr:hypothetical protein E4U53_005335 [Claviceps sorghi]